MKLYYAFLFHVGTTLRELYNGVMNFGWDSEIESSGAGGIRG